MAWTQKDQTWLSERPQKPQLALTFRHLTLSQGIRVYQAASPREKDLLREALRNKAEQRRQASEMTEAEAAALAKLR